MPAKLTIEAHAKINLGLDVLRKREDGYHDVKMIMQSIGLCDELTFEEADDNVTKLVIQQGNVELSAGEDNLILRAFREFQKEYGPLKGYKITLIKSIPIAAGMAGGSTDCAATLVALNELTGKPFTLEKLKEIGVKIGADVPYCIMGGTALSEGIGEILKPLPAPPFAHVLIAKPPISVSTAFVYGTLNLNGVEHPDIDGMVTALENNDLKGITDRFGNVLESVTANKYPEINKIKKICDSSGALGSLMSGSGPTVFALFDEKYKAEEAKKKIAEESLSKEIFITEFYNG